VTNGRPKVYQRREYREEMGEGRFTSVTIAVGESDLYIGWRGSAETWMIKHSAARHLRRLRGTIFTHPDPKLLSSLVPLEDPGTLAPPLKAMFEAARRAGVGPMAAVAGAIAEEVGRSLVEEYHLEEVVIENGGDLYLTLTEPLNIRLWAPTSPFTNRIALRAIGTLGVATSSATYGHGLSRGQADAVMVAAKSASLADGLATAYCNAVQSGDQIEEICQRLVTEEGVLGAIITIGDKLAVGGELEVVQL
jgi:ApbE superfamily uncharacterized protein (UPF0280 family)